ncbi:MAG: zinc ribbon domain-containing protein [Tannerella sp.]|jgi:hypothetical protein|nr:zinc ribbon domain-containing protein [Tannerella sp.]
MNCNKCNFQNEDNAKFCKNCGVKLNGVEKKTLKTVGPIRQLLSIICVWGIGILVFFIYKYYSSNKDKNKQLFVKYQCDQNVKLKISELKSSNWGGQATYACCVISEKAYIYYNPHEKKIRGYITQGDQVIIAIDTYSLFDGKATTTGIIDDFVEIFSISFRDYKGYKFDNDGYWIKKSDIMEITY